MIVFTDEFGLLLAGIVNMLIMFNYYIWRHQSNNWIPQVRDFLFVPIAFVSFTLITIFLRIIVFKIWGEVSVPYHMAATIICLIYGIYFLFGSFCIAPTLKNTISFIIALIGYVYFIYLDHDTFGWGLVDIIKMVVVMLLVCGVEVILSIICKYSESTHNFLDKPFWDLSEKLTPRVLIIICIILWFVGQGELLFRFEGYTFWSFILDRLNF